MKPKIRKIFKNHPWGRTLLCELDTEVAGNKSRQFLSSNSSFTQERNKTEMNGTNLSKSEKLQFSSRINQEPLGCGRLDIENTKITGPE